MYLWRSADATIIHVLGCGGVGDAAHFDGGLRAVHKLTEHPRAHVTRLGPGGQGLRRGGDVERIVFAFAGDSTITRYLGILMFPSFLCV